MSQTLSLFPAAKDVNFVLSLLQSGLKVSRRVGIQCPASAHMLCHERVLVGDGLVGFIASLSAVVARILEQIRHLRKATNRDLIFVSSFNNVFILELSSYFEKLAHDTLFHRPHVTKTRFNHGQFAE
jgi:hypothetical protein